jgi:hypothetical protein
MTVKEQLRAMVETLSEDDAALLLRALQGDRLAWMLLTAPIDDEPLSSDDEAALAEAQAEIAAGRTVPHDEARRRLLPPA